MRIGRCPGDSDWPGSSRSVPMTVMFKCGFWTSIGISADTETLGFCVLSRPPGGSDDTKVGAPFYFVSGNLLSLWVAL